MKCFVKTVLCLVLSLSLLVTAENVSACTTFCLQRGDDVLFGKNYDWMIGDGIIFVNKRGVAKTSLGGDSSTAANPAKWTSLYGSVTFNQYGRENPMGGMNEAGLVVELMWLDEARYPAKTDPRPALDTLEWIQYQLDTAATIDEVLKNAETVRIDSRVTLHYLVSDKTGNAASVEFLDGKLIARTGEKLPVAALANDTYEKSWAYAQMRENFGGSQKLSQQSAHSLDRFTRAASGVREFEKIEATTSKINPVGYAFSILENVAQKGYTQWSIVYDQKAGKIYFRSLAAPAIKIINAKTFDYSCGAGAVKILDLNTAKTGDVSNAFENYSSKANRDLIERSFDGTPFLRGVPAAARDAFVNHAKSFSCGNSGGGGGGGGTIVIKKPSKETLAETGNGATQISFLQTISPAYLTFAVLRSFFIES